MVSAIRLVGYLFQIAGMLVMFYAFVMLVIGIQGIMGNVTGSMGQSTGLNIGTPPQNCTGGEAEQGACEDFSTTEGLNAALENRVIEFVKWLVAGIVLLLIGLLLRAGDEIGGFWARLQKTGKIKVPAGFGWRDLS
jgi:hypothetical protein